MFEFDSSVYGHKTVKKALIEAQHGKCCFCEAKVVHISYGDVEHFRPKGGVSSERGRPPRQAGVLLACLRVGEPVPVLSTVQPAAQAEYVSAAET